MRDIPMREKKVRKRIESDEVLRASTANGFPAPDGSPEFKQGYRECIEMFSMHAPNKRGVGKILEDHCITLEDECIRTHMARPALAQYEGYRQALKDLKARKKLR